MYFVALCGCGSRQVLFAIGKDGPRLASLHGPFPFFSCVVSFFVGVVARCLALNNGRSMFAAGVGIHPTFQLESLAAGGTTAMELGERTQNKPILFLPAKEDDGLKASSPVVQTMAKRRGVTAEHISVEFPTMPHGFVSRGRFMGPEYRIAQDRAIQLTVDFMEKHLKV